MALTHRNQNREFESLRRVVDHLFENGVDYRHPNWVSQDSGPRIAKLPIDVYSTDEDLIIVAALPGLDADDVTITVEGDTLSIEGEIVGGREDADTLFSERYHGRFSRNLTLNVAVDVENINAEFEKGVLTVTLPKSEEIRPKTIKVNVK